MKKLVESIRKEIHDTPLMAKFHQYGQGIGGSSAIYALIGAAVVANLKRRIFWDLYTG